MTHHITVNKRPMCEARMDIRHEGKGCEYSTRHAAEIEAKRLRALFRRDKFRVVQGGCPVYSDEYRGVALGEAR